MLSRFPGFGLTAANGAVKLKTLPGTSLIAWSTAQSTNRHVLPIPPSPSRLRYRSEDFDPSDTTSKGRIMS